jgi:hypothetical protein
VLSPLPPVATRSILAVAHLRLAPTSSASISATERRSPSGVSQDPVQHEPGTEFVWFSPSEELRTAEAVMLKNMQAMQDGSTP